MRYINTVSWIGGNVAVHIRKVDNAKCKVLSLIVDADTEGCVFASLDISVEITHFSLVPTPMSFEEEFAACNFDVLISMLSKKVLHILSEKRNTSVRPQLFKWWIPLSTVDNEISFHNSYLLNSDLPGG